MFTDNTQLELDREVDSRVSIWIGREAIPELSSDNVGDSPERWLETGLMSPLDEMPSMLVFGEWSALSSGDIIPGLFPAVSELVERDLPA